MIAKVMQLVYYRRNNNKEYIINCFKCIHILQRKVTKNTFFVFSNNMLTCSIVMLIEAMDFLLLHRTFILRNRSRD